MKFTEKNKHYKVAVIALTFALAITVTILLGLSAAPAFVSYSVSTSDTVSDTSATGDNCLYREFSQIKSDGPFEIRCEDQNIYIFDGDKRLYKIKATLDRFTLSDVNLMQQGFSAQNLSELCEIVQYMES